VTASALIRADGGTAMGGGHLMRGLALAEALRPRAAVTFLTRGQSTLVDHIREAGFRVVELGAAHPDPEDAAAVLRFAHTVERPWIVVDGYHFDERYLARLRGARVLVVDDGPRLPQYDVDALLDQNIGALQQRYPAPRGARLLLGPRFTMLRPGFAGLERRAGGGPVPRLLVAMGGGDAVNATRLVLDGLRTARTRFEISILIGGANPHADALEAEFGRTAGWRFLRNVRDVAGIMASADIAVAGVGGVMWELACAGVPALLVSVTDVQRAIAARVQSYGAHKLIGDAAALSPAEVARAVEELTDDCAARLRMSELGRKLVDGRGAARVADALLEPTGTLHWEVRHAQMIDAEAIWEIATDPSVREQSFTVDAFPYASHEAWLADRLARPTASFWVAEQSGTVAGFVRYEVDRGAAMVNVAVAPAFRGRGAGRRLLADTWRPACERLGVDRARGYVFETNAPSQTAFARAGFVDVARETVAGRRCVVFEMGERERVG